MARYTMELREVMRINPPDLTKYPIFKEEYRERLNDLIIKSFYFREIGFQTENRFNLELENKLNLIMPTYNQMYKALDNDFDLTNSSYNEVFNTRDAINKNADLDTPQDNLDLDLSNLQYASRVSKNENTDNTKTNSKSYTGIAPEKLIAVYSAFENVDSMVLNELNSLFMLVY